MTYKFLNKKILLPTRKIFWKDKNGYQNEELFYSIPEAEAFLTTIKQKKVTQTEGRAPNCDEMFVLTYDSDIENHETILAVPFNSEYISKSVSTLTHNTWQKVSTNITNCNFADSKILFKYVGYSNCYIRGVRIYQTSDPSKEIRWGSFSDEISSFEDTFHLRAGSEDVEENYLKDEIRTIKIHQIFSNAQMEITKNIIPEKTQDISVIVEFWIDGEGIAQQIPLNEQTLEFSDITIEEIDQSENTWIEELEFDNEKEALKAISLGKDKYSPLTTEKTVENKVTMLELALVDLYEGRL